MKTKKISKRDLQPPFREKDLLSASSFISYCYKYGINTDKLELEYFEKQGLLLPAARVNKGVIKYKRVLADYDGKGNEEWRYVPEGSLDQTIKTYKVKQIGEVIYGHGSFWMTDDWLDWYKERDMVLYPAQQKFRPWKTYNSDRTWATKYKDLGRSFETFYSPLQIYPLQFVKNRRSFTFKNAGLFRTSEYWVEAGKTIEDIFTKDQSNEFIKQKVLDYYRLFSLIIEIQELWERKQSDMLNFYQKFLKENKGKEREARDDLNHHEPVLNQTLSADAKKLLMKNNFSIDSLGNWRLTFLGFGTFGLRIKAMSLRKPYLKLIDEEILATTEDPYQIVYLINWFIKLCGGKRSTIRELILGFSGKYCPYCGVPIPSPKINQTSCGSEACAKRHGNELKKRKRKSGEYEP